MNDKMKSLLAYITDRKSEVKPEGGMANLSRYSTLQEIESWIMIYGGINDEIEPQTDKSPERMEIKGFTNNK
ncbi:hypothetical protein EBU94_03825 [bacterium]|nr:hypothetical protein [bacterium]